MDNGIPRHIAIIMDGNGRWARQRQLPRVAGHRAGVEAVREIVRGCASRGVEALTLFTFSSENWRRPKREVRLLMDLFITALEQEVEKLNQNNVRLRIIGDIEPFSHRLRRCITDAEALTANNSGLNLVIAANYGGRWDIAQAATTAMRECSQRGDAAAVITPEQIQRHLALADLPEPDLFIRSGGEQRISNFMMWQLAYTELYFTDLLWPDFDDDALAAAIESYRGRQRRFGMTGEQVEEGASAQPVTTSA